MTATEVDQVLQPVKVKPVRIEHGRETKGSGTARFLEILVMVMLLYMAVLFYGISVMRSVIEEKTSRIIEVLLSSASSTELMTGKLLGVGAVGLTQIAGVDCDGGSGRSARARGAAQLERARNFSMGDGCVRAVLPSRLPALQHDVCHDWGYHDNGARGPATAILDRDSACPLGVHADAGHPHARLCRGRLDVD